MSVQVRRRREAASFLASFVGAQGELLVDTTNNRLQVHDGATPGGFPSALVADLPGRNVVINGNFSVNQRSYVSGTAVAQYLYAFHDRWKSGGNGGTYTFGQSPTDTIITITAGSIAQSIDAPNIYATSFWLTWAGTSLARVYPGSSAPTAYSPGVPVMIGGVTVNALLVTGLAIGAVTNVEFSTGTVGLVQLEAALPNAGPTRFERRLNELQLCQRYFWASNTTNNKGANIGTTIAQAWLNYAIALSLRYPVVMRAAPTVSLYNNGVAGQVRNSNSGGIYQLSPNNFGAATAAGFPFVANSANTGLVAGNYYDFDLIASAEL